MDSKDLKQISQVVGVEVAERLDKFETKLKKYLIGSLKFWRRKCSDL